MCELVVWVVGQKHDDPYMDAQAWKKGDVICAVDDGHAFSPAERSNADWTILTLPGVSVEAVASFLAGEPETDPSNPSRMLQRRQFRIDTKKKIKTLADLMAARVKKPPLRDPNVIG